jgi:hypothetical protein
MKRIAFAICLLLTACTSAEEKARIQAADQAKREADLNVADNAACLKYGYIAGTVEYANCRIIIDQNRQSQQAALRQQVFGAYLNQQAPYARR